MRIGKDCREDKSGTLRGSRVSWASELADGEILEIPLPTTKSACQAAEETIGIGGGEQPNGGANSLAASFVKASLEKIECRNADGTEEASHGRNHVVAARFGEQQRKAIEEAFGITLQETRENGVQRAIGERGVDEQEPAILGDEAMCERGEMIMLGVARSAFESFENSLEPGPIGAADCDAAERLDKGGQKRCGFGDGFSLESFHGAAMQLLGKLVEPERLDDWSELVESSRDGTARGRVFVIEATRIVEDDVAGFTTRSVGTGFSELAEGLPQSYDRNAPNLQAAEHRGLFARREI